MEALDAEDEPDGRLEPEHRVLPARHDLDRAAFLRGPEGGVRHRETEPLPAESPLWSMPNVIVTPHSSGSTPGNLGRADAIFVDNVGRYMRCEPLRNEV